MYAKKTNRIIDMVLTTTQSRCSSPSGLSLHHVWEADLLAFFTKWTFSSPCVGGGLGSFLHQVDFLFTMCGRWTWEFYSPRCLNNLPQMHFLYQLDFLWLPSYSPTSHRWTFFTSWTSFICFTSWTWYILLWAVGAVVLGVGMGIKESIRLDNGMDV